MFPLKRGGKEKRKEEPLQIKTLATLNHPTPKRNFLPIFQKKVQDLGYFTPLSKKFKIK